MRHANTLMGGNADRFLDDKIGPQDLHFYNYPADTDVQKAKLRIIYLGYYIEDWSGKNNAEFAISKGLQTREDAPENTGDLWGVSAVDEDFRIVNQHIKYLKFGFGHVTDQVMERIHAGKITREEGLKLVEQFDQGCGDHYIEKLADFLEMPPEALRKKIEKTRSLDIWSQNKDGNWALNRGFYRPEQVKEKAANG